MISKIALTVLNRSHFVLGVARRKIARIHVLIGFVSELWEFLGPVEWLIVSKEARHEPGAARNVATHQYGIFRHSFSSRTTLMISPSTLLLALVRSSLGVRSIKTNPPRLIQMVFRKRSASSTRTGLVLGRVQVYRLFPSAFVTRTMTWSAVSSSGGVADSAAAATMLRLGFPMSGYLVVATEKESLVFTGKRLQKRKAAPPTFSWRG